MIAPPAILSGRYRLEARLAQGGMGDVYRATDLREGRSVVVKLLRGAAASDVRRFAGEARVLARLDHPAIVDMYGTGEHDGVSYLVLGLVDGPSLKELLVDGPLDPDRVGAIVADVASGLAHAHARGIIHRDVKPGNVLTGADGRARVTDFGIARLADMTGLTETGTAVGTAAYLAPEQLDAEAVTRLLTSTPSGWWPWRRSPDAEPSPGRPPKRPSPASIGIRTSPPTCPVAGRGC